MYFRLPSEIQKIELNEGEMWRKIRFSIENLYGIDSMVFSPFKAFEAVARKQILLLKEPIEKCLDLVIDKLCEAVEICSERVSVKFLEKQFT